MYCVNELLGLPLQHNVKEHLRRAQCPYMRAVCDGGGNRNMARLPDDHALASLFDPDVLQEGDNHIHKPLSLSIDGPQSLPLRNK